MNNHVRPHRTFRTKRDIFEQLGKSIRRKEQKENRQQGDNQKEAQVEKEKVNRSVQVAVIRWPEIGADTNEFGSLVRLVEVA